MAHSKTKQQYLLAAANISLRFNAVLFVFKFAALLIVRSLAIATDFSITVVGLIVSIILYKSLKLSSKPADLLHNYGYGKVEHVCEAVEGIVLIGIALIMCLQAVSTMFHPGHVTFPWVGFGSSVLSLSLNFIGAAMLMRLAEKSSSPAVRAEGIHYRLEGFISTAIALSFLAAIALAESRFAFAAPYLDPLATILVSAAVTAPSLRLAKQAFVNLLDVSIEEPSKMEAVVRLGQYADYYCSFRDLKSRKAGHRNFIEMKIIMPRDMNFAKAYRVVSSLEQDIAKSVPHSDVLVAMVPCLKDCDLIKEGKPCPYYRPAGPSPAEAA